MSLESTHQAIIPGLPDDLAYRCLAKVSHGYHGLLEAVSKTWRAAIRSLDYSSIKASEGWCGNWLFVLTEGNNTHWIAYDPDANRWHPLPKIPRPNSNLHHYGFSCVSVHKKFLVIGGSYASHDPVFPHKRPFVTNDVMQFDPFKKEWCKVASMRTPRSHFACSVVCDKVYVAGGRKSSSTRGLDHVEVYDPLEDSPNFLCKVVDKKYLHGSLYEMGSVGFEIRPWIRSAHLSNLTHQATEPANYPKSEAAIAGNADVKVKRKKLKGKRAVVRWLKYFRYKKKKDFERMTTEEKILYKLKKARNKETRLVESLKKIEPPESAEATHDPEILTPEEHFYFLKMGLKCKNYVPVGRRGIFQGVILNMHLHWKKHQTLQVVVKTFTPEEVKEIAAELARLSGGIVLDIHEENTIIMYRGKNYSQPPTEIMSPKITLSRKKALDKSKYRDGLRALRRFIPRLEQDLELLKSQALRKEEINPEVTAMKGHETEIGSSSSNYESLSNHWMENSDNDRVRKMIAGNEEELYERESSMESSDVMSDSEALSDIFETDTEGEEAEDEKKAEKRPLYLDEFDKFPTECDGEAEDFEEHLRQISADSKNKSEATDKNMELPDLDEVDRMFLRAGSLLRRKRR